MTTTMMKMTTSRTTGANRLNDFAGQRDEQIINNQRFGEGVEMMILCLLGDDVESDALYPECSVLEERGYDVATIASALDTGAIGAGELGALIAELSVSEVNNEVLTAQLRHYDGCELDMDVVRAAGCDEETIATALYEGALSKVKLLSMLRNLEPADVDTAVHRLLCCAHASLN